MADSDVTLKIKADTKQAVSDLDKFTKGSLGELNDKIETAKTRFTSLFSSSGDSAVDLAKDFAITGVAVAAVGFAVKEAFEKFSEVAEIASEIQKINDQFDFLASKAGTSGVALGAAFADINGGIVETKDVLKAANTALVNLSLPAADLVKNFEAAKRSAVALGGDTLQNFEAINTAISSGNTRVLRQIGLFIDAGTATDKYAASIGVASKFLSDAQKQTAIFEAIQNKVAANFSNVDITTRTTAVSFKAFGTATAEVGDAIAIALNKIFGPSVSKLLDFFAKSLGNIANEVLVRFGTQTQAAGAATELFNKKLEDQIEHLKILKATQELGSAVPQAGIQKQIVATEALIQKLEEQQQRHDELKQHQLQANDAISAGLDKRIEKTEQEKRLDLELAKAKEEFSSKVLALEAANTQAVIQRSDDTEKIEAALATRQIQIQTETETKITDFKRTAALERLGTKKEIQDAEDALVQQGVLAEQQARLEADQRIVDSAKNAAIIKGNLSVAGGLKTLIFEKDLVDKQLALAIKGSEEEKKLKLKSVTLEKQIQDGKLQATSTALGNLSSLMQTNSKELFAIGKAAALADATIRGFQAFNLALATIPPPFGAIVGATSLVAAAVQIAKISSTNLATGITAVPAGFPNDSFAANLTSGERVVNVKQNQDLTEFLEANKNDSGPSNVKLDLVHQALLDISAHLQNLQNTTIVHIGNKEIMREVRQGIKSGQQVFT